MEVAAMKNGRPAAPGAWQAKFWEGVRSGLGVAEAGAAAGVGPVKAFEWFKQAGGVKGNGPRPAAGRYLSVGEREEIAVGLAAGDSERAIARRLGRSPSTVSREVARNSRGRGSYRALAAQGQAQWRAKTAKLAADGELRGWVQGKLEKKWSPEQISVMLEQGFPDRAGDAGVARDDLPVGVRAGAGGAAAGAGGVPADRAGAAQAAA
jgi:transposase, IS30 family